MRNLKEEIIYTVKEVPSDIQDNINAAIHQVLLAKEKEHGVGMAILQDLVVLGLEGVVVPEQESEELSERAEREGKTFQHMAVEYIARGLTEDAAADRALRISSWREKDLSAFGETAYPEWMN